MNTAKRGWAIYICLLAAVLLLAASVCLTGNMSVPAHAEQAAATVTYNFAASSELQDFTPVYSAQETDSAATTESFSAHWTQDATVGKVTSQRDAAGSGGAEGWNRIAQLVLSKYKFTHFEAEIVMNYAANAVGGWAGLQFRKKSLSSAGRKGGCFAFTQQEGHATLWGNNPFVWDDNGTERENKETPNPAAEAFKSTHKYNPFLLTVRVVGKSCDVTVSSADKATVYATVHTDFKKDDAVCNGFVSLTSGDDYHDFHSLKITNLNASGEPIALEESDIPRSITLDKSTTQYAVGEPVTLGCAVLPAAATSNVVWSVNDGAVAVVKGGSITGISAGTVTVTAKSAFDASVSDSVTLTFTDPALSSNRFAFTDASVLENFTATYVVDRDTEGDIENFAAHWTVSDGVLKRVNFPANNNDSSENFACLYINDCETAHFEATLVYRNTSTDYGWIGVTCGTLLYNKRCMDEGLGMFVQRDGQPTVWGKNTGGPSETTVSGYTPSNWHVLRVRAYGNRVEMYLDDMTTPAFTKNTQLTNGHVGFFTTCKAAFEIKSFTFAYLDENGAKEDYSGIEKLEIANKITSASVGDSLVLDIVVTPQADIRYTFTTSDSNVAFVHKGVLRFIGDGEVTVTVVCNHEKRLTDSMTVSVAAKSGTSIPPSSEQNPPTDEGNGNVSPQKKSGCGSSVDAGSLMGAAAAFVGAAVIAGKKKKASGR